MSSCAFFIAAASFLSTPHPVSPGHCTAHPQAASGVHLESEHLLLQELQTPLQVVVLDLRDVSIRHRTARA
eukprot:2882172-Rhodomonas_salina.1